VAEVRWTKVCDFLQFRTPSAHGSTMLCASMSELNI